MSDSVEATQEHQFCQAETAAVWQSMPGAHQLYEIYGYWPTLHDARVRTVRVDFANRGLEVTLDYNDLTEVAGQGGETCQRITLRWRGITESGLRLADNSLYGMDLARKDSSIETHFEDYVRGMDGYILSASVEVVHVELSSDISEDDGMFLSLS